MNYGIIGLSRRAQFLHSILIKQGHTGLIGAYDANPEYCQKKIKEGKLSCLITNDEDEFWQQKYDFVIIGSSNHEHTQHLLRAMKENVNIFCEKPIITKMSDYFAIKKCKEELQFNKLLATGFVLRYSPIFIELKKQTEKLGPIYTVTAIDAIKHTHGAHFYLGWRRFQETSGGFCVEKNCHSLDIINWCIGSYPVSVSATGSQSFWTPENRSKVEKGFLENDPDFYNNYQDYENNNSFDCDKTINDNITSTVRYENGTNLNFTMMNFAPNTRRYMLFYGLYGSVEMLWEMDHVTIKHISVYDGVGTKSRKGQPCRTTTVEFGHLDCHGGGDSEIMKGLVNAVQTKTDMNPVIQEAFYSNNACIAITESINKDGERIQVEY